MNTKVQCEHCQDAGSFISGNFAAFCPFCSKGKNAYDLHLMQKSALANTAKSAGLKSAADHVDPQGSARIAKLEQFCAELGRELETVQRERLQLWEENRRLRGALKRIAEIPHFQKPTITWRDMTLDCIGVAKAALGDKE